MLKSFPFSFELHLHFPKNLLSWTYLYASISGLHLLFCYSVCLPCILFITVDQGCLKGSNGDILEMQQWILAFVSSFKIKVVLFISTKLLVHFGKNLNKTVYQFWREWTSLLFWTLQDTNTICFSVYKIFIDFFHKFCSFQHKSLANVLSDLLLINSLSWMTINWFIFLILYLLSLLVVFKMNRFIMFIYMRLPYSI